MEPPARKRKFHETNPVHPQKPMKPTKVPLDKRRKRQDAREISAQTTENAFRDGQFDPVSFVNSREYEVKSLLRSMNSSKNAQRKRAFQSLPRELRRRTAAHNPSRVPRRVRETARREFAEDNTTIRKRRRDYRPSARRLNANQLRMLSNRNDNAGAATEPQNPTSRGIRSQIRSKSSRYRKRQRHKTWLPTHIWCAKRARMVCKWGFSLAETPNLKSYRPTYRAATQDGSIAVDTSYYATILLEGRERDLKRSLAKFLPPRDFAVIGRSVVFGESAQSTWMYEEGEWPERPITPIEIFWCPGDPDQTDERGLRKVVLRVHPASWDDAWKVATTCATASDCTCKNLRFEIGSIGLIGPRTMNILRALLNTSLDFEHMPANRIVHGSGGDPRLNSFYLRTLAPRALFQGNSNPASSLFDTKLRNESVKAQVSQKTLNSRIPKLVLGETAGSAADTRIPCVLMQETMGVRPGPDHPNSRSTSSHRWNILLPWKWVRPFWLVLMRMPGVRLGGLKELEQLTLENGVGYFPTDFPSTSAGRAEALERTQAQLDRIKRRSTMKTKSPSQSELTILDRKANFGYPWDEVFGADNPMACERPKIWLITPHLIRRFWESPQRMLPQSIPSAIFTAHVRIYGRGNIGSSASVYTFSGSAAKLVPRALLQHARDGKPIDSLLEKLDSENGCLGGTGQSDKPPYSLAGFVIRGSFGFCEAAPVATAALAWAEARESELSDDQGALSGWCILQNKGHGIKRLAQWTAI
ncbi:hypothetical protein TWF718_011385 [Orbilia javanica]|uniref:Pop1 n=1 Tax=Orbilia javanica TaxID=47235 RepID=A0AAN8MNQ2_9PEZI